MVRNIEKYNISYQNLSPRQWQVALRDLELQCYYPSEKIVNDYRQLLEKKAEHFILKCQKEDSILNLYGMFFVLTTDKYDVSFFYNNVVLLFWYLDSEPIPKDKYSITYINAISILHKKNTECFSIFYNRFKNNVSLFFEILKNSDTLCMIDLVSQIDFNITTFKSSYDNDYILDDDILATITPNLLQNFRSFIEPREDIYFSIDAFSSPYFDLVIKCLIFEYNNKESEFVKEMQSSMALFNQIHYGWYKIKNEMTNEYLSFILKMKALCHANLKLKFITSEKNATIYNQLQKLKVKQLLYWKELTSKNETINTIFLI